MAEREKWGSKLGFVLACVGAAVGLGNVYLFPWRMQENGGAAFLIIYLFLMILICVTGLIQEFALGRGTGRGAIGAFRAVFEKRKAKAGPIGAILGIIPIVATWGVLVFYVVIIGWIFRSFGGSVTQLFGGQTVTQALEGFKFSSASIPWHFLAILLTLGIVLLGVRKGIERANKIFLPVLLVVFVILIIRGLTLPGASEGIAFVLKPQWEYFFKIKTWAIALSQGFFSVCLGGASMVVFGSYLPKDRDLTKAALQTAGLDTIVAIMAALMIFPAAFAVGVEASPGSGILFNTVPRVFETMGFFGSILNFLFWLSMVFVVLSSSIALMEAPTEAIMDKFKTSRKVSALIIAGATWLASFFMTTNPKIFGPVTNIVPGYLVPLGAILSGITFYWVLDKESAMVSIKEGLEWKVFGEKWFYYYGKYVFVIASFSILALSLIWGIHG